MVRSTLRKLLGRLPKRWQGWLAYQGSCQQRTFGQFGEDLLIGRYLTEPTGFYVDIGAFHPKYRSNTYQLWKRGWHGINVDIDQYKIDLFHRFRPGDVSIVTGLSSEPGERQFYFQEQESYGSMSSLDESFARDRGERMNRSVASRSVQVTTLNDLFSQHLPSVNGAPTAVDLVNIDVEGHEFEILRVFDFHRYRPKCFCVEIHATTLTELQNNPTYQLLIDQGYEMVAWPSPSVLFLRGESVAKAVQQAA